ncbi:hypothetical protein MPSEU_000386000 [Mayamaea pseudoterrestris]|nr:hypothetical protein MPSEU_000386000 [Mayamaea pseudoterrestris]
MSFQSNMNSNDELLASAMMLFTISEDSSSFDAGRPSSFSSLSGDTVQRSGWGNALTRRSYKNDLCLLAGDSQQMRPSAMQKTAFQREADTYAASYGFFVQTC